MKRIPITPRPNWTRKVEELGFFYHSLEGIYWDERAYYSFSMDEILMLEKVTGELHEMCLAAAQHVIDNNLFAKLGIDERFVPLIIQSWNNEDPAIYGRFDLLYDGVHPPKMLEYNADTPTSLLEASVIQWYWLQDFDASKDQFNSIHEKLIAYWQFLKPYLKTTMPLHVTGVTASIEDTVTMQYMRDVAEQAGYKTMLLDITELGWDEDDRLWRDQEDQHIGNLFKLYPWEWLASEEFGAHILEDEGQTIWIEPPFKMLLSNKGILPILWELYPDHPNLLPAYFADDPRVKDISANAAVKPLLSREGANVTLTQFGNVLESAGGDYGKEGVIYQALGPIANFEGNHPVIGSWVIGQEASGMGIRESTSYITANTSRFVPHLIE